MSAQNSTRSATPASWKSGQSGNPGGRPKLTPMEKTQEFELRKACELLTPKALKVIADLMETADKESVRLAAAGFIVERAYGKPVERKEVRSGTLDEASTAELLEMLRLIRLQREKRSPGEHYFIHDARPVSQPVLIEVESDRTKDRKPD